MIVCRKPCIIYGVDAAGALGLLLLVVVGHFMLVAPAQQQQARQSAVESELATARTVVEETGAALRTLADGTERLRADLESWTGQAPTLASVPAFVNRIAAVAESAHLEVLQVVPAPPRSMGHYLASDIRVVARGTSLDFIRFLDRLRRENAFQTLHEFSITHDGRSGDTERCELAWTTRLHVLPAARSEYARADQ